MVSKITNKIILAKINSLRDNDVKTTILREDGGFCSVKYIKDHEKAFRSLIPDYFDNFLKTFNGYYENWSANRNIYLAYLCLQLGIVKSSDFRTVENFASAGIDWNDLYNTDISSIALFRNSVLKEKNGDKNLIEFLNNNSEYLEYFLPLMFSVDNQNFSTALCDYLKSARLQDSLRIKIFSYMLAAEDADTLLYFINKIEAENYYRFKALTEAAIILGNYTVILQPKDLIPILRDAANGNCDKYYNSCFKSAYHFIKTYSRTHSKHEFRPFALNLLKHGGDRARWALLNALSETEINVEYSREIFSRQLTTEDLSFFIYKIKVSQLPKNILKSAFENLFSVLVGMDKVSYHYKTDDDINFARDISRSNIVLRLGEIAARSGNSDYFAKLDSVYDSLKEEAQATYLNVAGSKTKLNTRQCAIDFLKTDNYQAIKYFNEQNIKLSFDEAVRVSDYLKSKKEQVKSTIIKAYLKSPDCNRIANYLLEQEEDYKKTAGNELLTSRGKIDKNKLADNKPERYFWESESVFTVEKPIKEIHKLASQSLAVTPLKPTNYQRVKKFFDSINHFISEHKDYEYAAKFGEGLSHFGSVFYRLKDSADEDNGFSAYPLGTEIKNIISSFSQEEIANALLLTHCVNVGNKNLYLAACGNRLFSNAGKCFDYVKELNSGNRFMSSNAFTIIYNLQQAVLSEVLDEKTVLQILSALSQKNALRSYRKNSPNSLHWDEYPHSIVNSLTKSNNKNIIQELTQIVCAFIDANLTESFTSTLIAKAYEYGFISAFLAHYLLLNSGNLYGFFKPTSPNYVLRADYRYPKFKNLLDEFIENALATEFTRGSLQTQYSEALRRTDRFIGADKFIKSIAALRGLTWARSSYCGYDKNEILSYILKNTVKSNTDTYENFTSLLNEYNITDDELLRATLFNPEFADYSSKYLKIPELKLAVFWFTAHLNECLFGEDQERRVEQIKEFSSISYADFKDGAFDYDWYAEMVQKVDEQTLKRIYADAKYVTVGGLHKRAQRFFDAVNGRISKSECIEKIKTSRNKDYCLIYSLIPLENNQDLYERYVTLAQFALESKQFGSQRQLSERRTVDIALSNLARSAGYSDTDIFIFEMEAQTPCDIFKTHEIDEIEITPYVDEQKFKVALAVRKNDKILTSLPSKYSKNATVVSLREQIKLLNRKLRRVISGFENCMCNRVSFSARQLNSMCRERVIQTVLRKLTLLADGKLCVYDGEIKDLNGNTVTSKEIYIAHPIQLKKLNLLQTAITYIAKNNIRQPFKQVLREIYSKTDLELTQDEVLRFKGFEVDVRKCVSALKGKGWGVSEDIGLRKVFYRSDTVAAIFRECDFLYTADFENVNRELHGIFFLKRKSGEILHVKDVDDITFSETLRDVDLMISISSKVIYDYELAMSTVEVRQEVLKSIIGILSVPNVTFLKDNIKINGYYGAYIVNIRTGLVFKEGKGNLALDTVYSIDKPILLDFVDEDPMTADIISKAVILAQDKNIKDSSILREIRD